MIARFAAFVACMTLDLAQTRMPFRPHMFAGANKCAGSDPRGSGSYVQR